jgi:hypothetical protein
MWCIPPAANAEFVYPMEDVLDVYHRPADPQHPVVCLDQATKPLIGEEPLPAKPGAVERCDCEYTARPLCSLPSILWRGGARSPITAAAPTGRTSSRSCWTGVIATPTR